MCRYVTHNCTANGITHSDSANKVINENQISTDFEENQQKNMQFCSSKVDC